MQIMNILFPPYFSYLIIFFNALPLQATNNGRYLQRRL
nr:MAG TPA: hypothetical protein [Caudoviricetes sp.]